MNAPAKAVHRKRRAVRREQMSDEVAGHLRAAIMSGTLLPGTFIRLDETAAGLGVSITPVREALRTLRGEGMVLLEPHRGHVASGQPRPVETHAAAVSLDGDDPLTDELVRVTVRAAHDADRPAVPPPRPLPA